ncbi:response regulator transcription factor [Pedococcus aerophilus]|uniref:Response regulator transcription factor n=1 Tax=Pedococcus aerophilus TaxID=436356 RepID=A0ABP6HCL3_9MICO
MVRNPTTRVLVVDDHTTFAELLAGALDREPDLESVGHATTAAAGVAMFRDLRPELVLMDVQLPDATGFDATRQIMAMDPFARVIVLTAHAKPEFAGDALVAGACGFLAKDGTLAAMLAAVRTARPGHVAVDPDLMIHLIADAAAPREPAVRLSDRQLDVLALLADGEDVQHIAKELDISLSTCRSYVQSILIKLNAHSQLEAVVIAARLGLVTIGRPDRLSRDAHR